MGSSKFETLSFPTAPQPEPKYSVQHLYMRDSGQSMFLPRYVSTWCLSVRKRCFDLLLSISGLILFAPVMILVGWLIKITSEGPALFRQERVGLNQKTFVILKFRTMKHNAADAERGSKVTKQGDPRMTSIGRLLRRLKLDELPQLINVARGEMSFVGPRPKIPQHESLCMLCRPGITGAATLVFSHEENLLTDIPEQMVEQYVTSVLNPEKCRLDSHYIETAKFGTDMRILMRTIFKLGKQPQSEWDVQNETSKRGRVSVTRHVALHTLRAESAEVTSIEV